MDLPGVQIIGFESGILVQCDLLSNSRLRLLVDLFRCCKIEFKPYNLANKLKIMIYCNLKLTNSGNTKDAE